MTGLNLLSIGAGAIGTYIGKENKSAAPAAPSHSFVVSMVRNTPVYYTC